MIPRKQPKFIRLTPSTDLQRLAQKENFSLFQIRSMLGQLTFMKQCATVPQSSVLSVENTLRAIEKKIRYEQNKRKQARKVKDNG
jgi:hypothetical protein